MKMVTPTEWVVEYRTPNLAKDCLDRGVFTYDGPNHPQHVFMVEKLDGDIYFFIIFLINFKIMLWMI